MVLWKKSGSQVKRLDPGLFLDKMRMLRPQHLAVEMFTQRITDSNVYEQIGS